VIKEMPLEELPNLIHAIKRREAEQVRLQMWLAHFTAYQVTGFVTGQQEYLTAEQFLAGAGATETGKEPQKEQVRQPEDVQADALAAVARFEKEKGKGGNA
jgi:hypothetical protein